MNRLNALVLEYLPPVTLDLPNGLCSRDEAPGDLLLTLMARRCMKPSSAGQRLLPSGSPWASRTPAGRRLVNWPQSAS